MIDIYSQLIELTDEKYKLFQSKLTNTKYEFLGCNTPTLKSIAKNLAKEYLLSDFNDFIPNCYEELTIYGLIIAYNKVPITDKFTHLKRFISLNDNWASNDIVISSLKNKSPEYFKFLTSLVNCGIWQTRFAIVGYLGNYLDEAHLSDIFQTLQTVNYGDYYVDMAVAWLLSIAYIKHKSLTETFLNTTVLPEFVLRKTISKICDSYRVAKEDKVKLRKWLKDKLAK